MKSTRHRTAVATPGQQVAQQHAAARVCEIRREDPESPAALATDLDGTLESCARIERFFKNVCDGAAIAEGSLTSANDYGLPDARFSLVVPQGRGRDRKVLR